MTDLPQILIRGPIRTTKMLSLVKLKMDRLIEKGQLPTKSRFSASEVIQANNYRCCFKLSNMHLIILLEPL